MVSKFTHRQDGVFSFSSICDKCLRVVATSERESELRADESVHSCGTQVSPASLLPDLRRENANRAAKARWVQWGLKKTPRLQ
jgi:hypothetical protein